MEALSLNSQERADQLGQRDSTQEEAETKPPPLEDVVSPRSMAGPAPPAIIQLPVPELEEEPFEISLLQRITKFLFIALGRQHP